MAEAEVDKNSFKSSFYDALDATNSAKYNLPDGLLKAIRVRGEASNADQVSDAGARSVYQIIPKTREGALKKYGIDAYLGPEQAAEVAARLVRDSLDRNGNSAPLAVAEYKAGTDRSNWERWGAVPYTQRVTGTKISNDGKLPQSTFDRVIATKAEAPPSSLTNIYNAYKSGAMTPEDAKQYESDVRDGKIMLPRGAVVNMKMLPPEKPAPDATPHAPEGVVNAWKDQKMTPAESGEFEKDVREGRIAVPDDIKKMIGPDPGVVSRAADATLEAVSGARRETESSRYLRDYTQLPELGHLNSTNLKVAVRTLFGDTNEKIKAIKENYPDIEVTKDEKGNPILKSKETGESYTMPPGFTFSDAPAAVANLATFELGGAGNLAKGAGVLKQATVNAAGQGAAQAGVEATKAAAGGEFSGTNVAAAAALGGAASPASRVIEAALPPVVNAVKNALPGAAERQAQAAVEARVMKGVPATPEAAPIPAGAGTVPPSETPAPAAAPVPAATPAAPVAESAALPSPAPAAAATAGVAPAEGVVIPASGYTADELLVKLRKAANGDKKAFTELAAAADQNPKIIEDAAALGMKIEPVQATKSQSFREIVQGVKSLPGADRTVELENLAHNQEVAANLITKLGGSHDAGEVSANVKKTLDTAYAGAKASAKKDYDAIRAGLPAHTPTAATDTLAFIEQRAKDMKGIENLSSEEREIFRKLSPSKTVIEPAREARTNPKSGLVVEPARPAVYGEGKLPTYALVDQVRQDIGNAKRGIGGEFGSADKRLLGQLEEHLTADQGRVAEANGMADAWASAKEKTRDYKRIQEQLETLFGKNLQDSIVGDMKGAVGKLADHDVSKMTQLISSIPDQLRHEVVATGLASAFGMNAKNNAINFNSYAKWFDRLDKSPTVKNALFANLPPEAVKQLTALANVSRGIAAANAARITTGRVNALLIGSDTLLEKIFNVAKKSGGALIAEAGSSAVGLPGVGLASGITSALTKQKPNVMKAADALISSPEFLQAVKTGTKQDISRLARSTKFAAFRKAAGSPHEMKDAERWIQAALIAHKSQGEKK